MRLTQIGFLKLKSYFLDGDFDVPVEKILYAGIFVEANLIDQTAKLEKKKTGVKTQINFAYFPLMSPSNKRNPKIFNLIKSCVFNALIA